MSQTRDKLLVANRGEIAVRILRTARRLGIPTVAVYTRPDATAPHVLLADESAPLRTSVSDPSENARGYLDAEALLAVCLERNVTLVHPGYGFLAENAHFARLLADNGITLLGPTAEIIESMGLKHLARDLAVHADVPVVPGSEGVVSNYETALEIAVKLGWPVILKATAGGGGMGLMVCRDEEQLKAKFESTRERAKTLFHNNGVLMEKFFDAGRHIEVQIFGDGLGHAVHMCERECSVQRRHQKIIEESPSPFLLRKPELREKICNAAVRLGQLIKYKSAGTVEFLVDDNTGDFYFLEMNTRLQVEHGVTEQLFPGLDIVELMILQGLSERSGAGGISETSLPQERFAQPEPGIHAIEARVYCEDPLANFAPRPGVLQFVSFPANGARGIRIDTWVGTGTKVTPYFDPLIAKVIVSAASRKEAIQKLYNMLGDSEDIDPSEKFIIQGPPTNVPFLAQICREEVFVRGDATTEWLDRGGVKFAPSSFTIVSPGLNTTIQALPTRDVGLGIPRSGPMDPLAYRVANVLAGNPSVDAHAEGDALEIVIPGVTRGAPVLELIFRSETVLGIAGADAEVKLNGNIVPVWSRLQVPKGGRLRVGGLLKEEVGSGGLRVYVAVQGGFTSIPHYLGSKATSMGVGGYQGRPLQPGDVIYYRVADAATENFTLPPSLIPLYPKHWTIYSLAGPQDDTEFLTQSGIDAFYARHWRVSTASNRMGIRLERTEAEAASGAPTLEWARPNGGEGGSHPSNILDNGYAPGTVNLNGDTPVILTVEGPSMGGYLCIATIASGNMWKVGQLRPGDTLQFVRISWADSRRLAEHSEKWIETCFAAASDFSASPLSLFDFVPNATEADHKSVIEPKLYEAVAEGVRPRFVIRQAGDSTLLVEYGTMHLDFTIRARVHAFETALRKQDIQGLKELAPCIRSTMIHYDPSQLSQKTLLDLLVATDRTLPDSLADMSFPGRKITFPLVLDDRWNREALERYMRSARDKAVYLPSNVEYLAKNNGLSSAEEALSVLVRSTWLVFGVGFYLACPFLVPIDPRCRLVGQKMNPSRTYTPRGALGIAGPVSAIYPVESPGGYQLFGRTLPSWETWGHGADFSPDKPWLLEPFDQVHFEVISEELYLELEREFDMGRYKFKIESVIFSMKEYLAFVESVKDEIAEFRRRQAEGAAREEAREAELLKEWQESRAKPQSQAADPDDCDTPVGSSTLAASVSGTVWKVKKHVGDVINSADDIVVVLEAMKTEVHVEAGDDNVGRVVKGFGKGIKEGAAVTAGDTLVVLD